ncbi:hypothetical protein KC367_g5432 [Hortaea werneckii]|uniref:ATP synthase subunit H, mitochondrial n=2 Tax=Hortaea werneckii TaxID=91943 RepID=A0A3M7IWL9_HORWE|nr:hypothetical protein KC361_g8825 [Hortaea werneckii]OTA35393.1 hypothetical protein BTJ68_03269 [Hortaea werneckii EXF-2000]KAI6840852.1 hypothetical protein KC342_g2650 [Hortaea werneckii]KAI6882572.1 hypothetical protein KC325_g5694 [Hortaea werneckii]KAI6991476.1 hypothetical protein KC359_g6215 [Hortaea werneckii]
MLGQSMRASRQLLARAARQQHAVTMRRTLITPTAVRQADLVQDMYLKELRAYKPTPVKPTDAEGQVQKFSIPKAPQSPEEADLANDLKAYEDQVPEVEGQTTGASEAAPAEQDWFEEPEEDEDEAHH